MTPHHVQLLISVRNVEEATQALAGGADFIDVKEPSAGPMGMASPEMIAAIAAAVAGKKPVSAALGELHQHVAGMLPGAETLRPLLANKSLNFIKLGLASAPNTWRGLSTARFAAFAPAKPIVVAYADWTRVAAPPVARVVDWACHSDVAGVLIDTAIKDGHHLLDWIPSKTLAKMITQARAAGLMITLAGSIRDASFKHAHDLRPDILAVRGAACTGNDRTAAIDPSRVRELADFIAARNEIAPKPRTVPVG